MCWAWVDVSWWRFSSLPLNCTVRLCNYVLKLLWEILQFYLCTKFQLRNKIYCSNCKWGNVCRITLNLWEVQLFIYFLFFSSEYVFASVEISSPDSNKWYYNWGFDQGGITREEDKSSSASHHAFEERSKFMGYLRNQKEKTRKSKRTPSTSMVSCENDLLLYDDEVNVRNWIMWDFRWREDILRQVFNQVSNQIVWRKKQ